MPMQTIFSAFGTVGRYAISSSPTLASRAAPSSSARGSAPARNTAPSEPKPRPSSLPTSTTPSSLTAPKLSWSPLRKLTKRIRSERSARRGLASGGSRLHAAVAELGALEHAVELRGQLRGGGHHRQAMLVRSKQPELLHHVLHRDRV